jgi:hypothetical protein
MVLRTAKHRETKQNKIMHCSFKNNFLNEHASPHADNACNSLFLEKRYVYQEQTTRGDNV